MPQLRLLGWQWRTLVCTPPCRSTSSRSARHRLRLAQTAFDERQRIQRDLHDDAQQRLVKVLMLLDQTGRQLAEGDGGMPTDVSDTVQRAHVELTDAVRALRELTQGIYPAVLIDHGLAAAVENLVDRAPLPVNATVTTRQ